jgi:ribosomal protein S21
MRVRTKRQKNESSLQFLKRFLGRVQKSGLVLESKKRKFSIPKLSERKIWENRMYRLKLQQVVQQKMKEGWPLEKALKIAKRYIKETNYRG